MADDRTDALTTAPRSADTWASEFVDALPRRRPDLVHARRSFDMPTSIVADPQLFTASAVRVLERASRLAATSQHLSVGPTHVLLALLEDESHAAAILAERGFDRVRADALLLELPTADLAPAYVVDPIAPPEDPDTRMVVLHATRFANSARSGQLVGSEHLLFGLTAVASPVMDVLLEVDLDEPTATRLNAADNAEKGEPLPVDFVIEYGATDASVAHSRAEVSASEPKPTTEDETLDESRAARDEGRAQLEPAEDDSVPEDEKPLAAKEFHDPSSLVDDIEMSLDELEATDIDTPSESDPAPRETRETPMEVGVEVYRVLDAAANRAREGLRVAEDHLRFVLDDAHLVGLLKSLRHDVTAATASLDERSCIRSRDTSGDVGTAISTKAESRRGSSTDVLRAALKRAEEALRSLEEFGKLVRPETGAAFESHRYRLYTLEKAILGTLHGLEVLAGRSLYLLLTRELCGSDPERVLDRAIAGGVSIVQLREKEMSDREFLDWADRVRTVTRDADVTMIVNDRPDLAVLCDADGVHVGQDDVSIRQARRIVGPRRIVGVSTHDLAQARTAVLEGADYIGVGPTFPSRTKSFDEFAGLEFVRAVSREIRLPTYVLGGVDTSNVAEVVRAGGRRVAVTGAISSPADPADAASALLAALRKPVE